MARVPADPATRSVDLQPLPTVVIVYLAEKPVAARLHKEERRMDDLTLLFLWLVVFTGSMSLMIYVLRSGYRRQQAKSLPDRRPRVQWFPKYRATIAIPAALLGAEDSGAALGDQLGTLGFVVQERNDQVLSFKRGSVLGDFSTKLTKVDLIFSLPLSSETGLVVEYGTTLVAFDTGDLWALTAELKEMLESAGAPAA
jgi:hypothetical protein